MTGFHVTSLEIGTLALEAAIFLGWLASHILGRSSRNAEEPRRPPGARYVDAAGFPGPATPHSVLGQPVRLPSSLTDSVVDAVFADLLSNLEPGLKSTLHSENLRRTADIADQHRMPVRPAPPVKPGEWEQRVKNDTLGSLVEPAESEFNPGEPS